MIYIVKGTKTIKDTRNPAANAKIKIRNAVMKNAISLSPF